LSELLTKPGNLILVGGKKGSGKGLCASYLQELGYIELSFAKRLKQLLAEFYGFDYNRLLGLTEEDREWREQVNELSLAPRHPFIWSFDSVSSALSFVCPFWSLYNDSSDYEPIHQGFSKIDLVRIVLHKIKQVIFNRDLSPRQLMQILGTDIFRALWKDIWCQALYLELQHMLDKKVVISDGRFENEASWAKSLGFTIIFVERNLNNDDNHPSENLNDFKSLADIILDNNGSPAELKISLLKACHNLTSITSKTITKT
jgi:hypothetical protein